MIYEGGLWVDIDIDVRSAENKQDIMKIPVPISTYTYGI